MLVGPHPAEQARALRSADRPLRAGAYATVEITAAAPHHLVGRFVDVVAEPAHKRRIAVLAG